MKKTLSIIFSLFMYLNTIPAFAEEVPNHIPDEFYITEHWLSLTTSYDIESKTQKFGTLYRKLFSFLLTYDFYDPFNNKIAYAKSQFFSLTAHFDVYDSRDEFLGAADEKLFAFFPTFDIYARDGYTKLAKASMNFWGTTFYIYDPLTGKEMAYMSRSFFRLKNDWVFHVSNRSLFEQKVIDPRVLMTVIAFQGDREYWESQQHQNNVTVLKATQNSNRAPEVSKEDLNQVLEKVAAVTTAEGFDSNQVPDEETVAFVAKELEDSYKNSQAADNAEQTPKDKINNFTEYCLKQVQSNAVSYQKKKVILFLLKTRLNGLQK